MKHLGTRLALLVIPVLLAGTTVLVGVLNAAETERLGRFLTREARSYAGQYAVAAGRRLESGLDAAATLASLFGRSAGGAIDRERASTFLRDALEGLPEAASIWSLWEPDAFDGPDARRAGAPGSRADGRFAPVWHSENGLPEPAVLEGGGGEAYALSRSLAEPVLLEPRRVSYSASRAGDPAGEPLVGLVAPILRDGVFLGVVGVDVPLSRVASYVTAQKPVGSGIAYLVGNGGSVLVHPEPALAGRPLSALHPGRDGAAEAVARGAELDFRGASPATGEPSMTALAPVTVGRCRRPWSMAVEIPLAVLFTEISRARTVSVGLGLVVVAAAAASILVFARAAARPVTLAAEAIRDIAEGEGDLTRSLAIRRDDEVGQLADSFNRFSGKLRVSIGKVQESTQLLSGAGAELSSAMDRSASALGGILRGAERVREGAAGQAAAARSTREAIGAIAAAAESFDTLVAGQGAAVAESSAATEEAVANVRSIAATMETLAGRYRSLVEAGVDGKSRIAAVDERIEAIAARSSRLAEANELLSSIAGSTNLLAMNAAIEAAHAGEAGKGFSVVAEEIRRLAEGAAEHTTGIGKDLEAVRESVDGVVEAGRASGEAFERVLSLIGDVETLVTGARDALAEQDRGSARVLEALASLSELARRVSEASAEIRAGSGRALGEIERLEEASRSIGAEMEGNARDAAGIEESTARVRELVARVAEAIGTVRDETERFKCVECD